ncbi:MAG: ABC transporter substrate-binding protein [Bacteroidetes bacterium]|nr:ABC transporter substrate-binding protein [Bacteroidota bacterium]
MFLKEDQLLPLYPQRIVSLVPSVTELLYTLGLNEETVGITKFCVHPKEWFRTKPRMGGTKSVHTGAVKRANPQLIIANKEENVKEQVETLAKEYPVLLTDVNDCETALQTILHIGNITGKSITATQLTDDIRNRFATMKKFTPLLPAAYLIWNEPYMTIGGDTFISDMMQHCGLINVFADEKRYPVITPEILKEKNCALILLSSEPYPFKQKHIDILQKNLPGVNIQLADGELFSWYGSRMLLLPEYMKKVNSEWAMMNRES